MLRKSEFSPFIHYKT